MLGNIGWREIVVIALIVILVFGAGRLPELFRGVGKSLLEFRKALKDNRPEV